MPPSPHSLWLLSRTVTQLGRNTFWDTEYIPWNKQGHVLIQRPSICHQLIEAETKRPRFADDIFLSENVWILIKISLKFVPRGPINNIPSLIQVMAWRWLGNKPLSETMMFNLPTHICVTRPQWVKLVNWWFRYWLVICLVPNPYLSQCYTIVNHNQRNKFQWDFKKNAAILIQKNWFESAGWQSLCLCLDVLICTYWQKTGNLGLHLCFIFKDSFKDVHF